MLLLTYFICFREIAVFTYAGYINPSAGVFYEEETNLKIISGVLSRTPFVMSYDLSRMFSDTVHAERILGMSMFTSTTILPSSLCNLIVPDAIVLRCLRELLQKHNYIDPIYSSDLLEVFV